MTTPLFSISIICKNEEDSLPKLHASLTNFIELGGEIVVVDTGSTDKTIEVLQSLGYKNKKGSKLFYEEVGLRFIINLEDRLSTINEKFIDPRDPPFTKDNTKLTVFDFCSARRYAGSLTSNKWILSVDCDEIFSALDIEAINQLISSGFCTQISFTFRYRNTDGSIGSITSRDKLYDKTKADWKWLVHEQVKPLGKPEDVIASKNGSSCLHEDPGNISYCINTKNKKTSNFKSIDSAFGKDEDFTIVSNVVTLPENIIALDHYQHPAEHRSNYLLSMCVDVMKDPNDQHVFWLGRDMHFRGYHYSAIKILKGYLEAYPNAWSAERCMAVVYIGDAHVDVSKKSNLSDVERKKYENEGMTHYFLGTLYEPTFREPWLRIGYHYYKLGEFNLAAIFINAAIGIKVMNKNYMNDQGCYGWEPFMKLYISLYAIGNKLASRDVWLNAKRNFPDNTQISDHAILFKDNNKC
jgi:glycosyltransferase involved in cell wall biosynthesis